MPVYCVWDDPAQTIMRIYFDAPWSWAEYHEKRSQADQQIRDADHTVGCILELPEVTHIGPEAVAGEGLIGDERPANLAILVIVTPNPIYQGLVEIVRRLSQNFAALTALATTTDEARAIVQARIEEDDSATDDAPSPPDK